MNNLPSKTKVLVIGGGPIGGLTAAMLAREGVEVTVLEKEEFPRYHIGESLLPSVLPTCQFAGCLEKIAAHGFLKKPGGYFKPDPKGRPGYIDFADLKMAPGAPGLFSYQVIRSDFDNIILQNAKDAGAKCFHGVMVTDIEVDEHNVPRSALWMDDKDNKGKIYFDYVVDASGQSGVMANKVLKNRRFQTIFKNIALCRYWKNTRGIEGPTRASTYIETLTDHSGWIWFIPLHNDTVSIGIVIKKDKYDGLAKQFKNNDEMYNHFLTLAPGVMEFIGKGEPIGEAKYWNDYSYSASEFGGPGFRIAGDAAGFLDPCLSTGVHIGSIGALSAAATITASIKGDCTEKEAAEFHNLYARREYLRFYFAIAGVYKYIRNQPDTDIEGVEDADMFLAFEALMPMLNKIKSRHEKINQLMHYCGDAFIELFGIPTKSGKVARLLASKINLSEQPGISFDDAINNYYIRLKKGNLGLSRVTLFERARNLLRKSIEKAIFLYARGKK